MEALQSVPFESAIGDLTDTDSMREAFRGCEVVFHLAAVADYWRADKDWMFKINVEGTRNVLQAARDAGVRRVVFTSSAAAVGLPADDTPADESVPFNLPPEQFPYGYSKVLAEDVVQEAVANGQDVVTVNPTVILGPGDLNMISGTFVTQLKQWQWLTPGTSGGLAVIDVRDVARMHIAAADHGRTGERYLLNTANYTYREWFNLIADVLDVAPPVLYAPDAILPLIAWLIDTLRRVGLNTPVDANQVRLGARNVYFDASKAYEELATPQIDMRQSVQDTYTWYQEHDYLDETLLARLIALPGALLKR
jgi:dihydroflavonol-4-reductase